MGILVIFLKEGKNLETKETSGTTSIVPCYYTPNSKYYRLMIFYLDYLLSSFHRILCSKCSSCKSFQFVPFASYSLPDPYVSFKVVNNAELQQNLSSSSSSAAGEQSMRAKSKVIRKTSNPLWNQTLTIPMPNTTQGTTV